jgi:hypothetical protein
MIQKKGNQIGVPLPSVAIKDKTPITAQWANTVRIALQRLSNRRNDGIDDNGVYYITPPFWPTFYGKPDVAGFFVKLSHGVVIDHDPTETAADALLYYPCSNELTGAYLTEFQIADGEGVFVKCTMLEDWSIDPATEPEIVIEDKDIASTNPTSSGGGIHYYKIATLEEIAGEIVITPYAAGNNIEHYRQKSEQAEQDAAGADGELWFYRYGGEGPFKILEWTNGKITTTGNNLVTFHYDGWLEIAPYTPTDF